MDQFIPCGVIHLNNLIETWDKTTEVQTIRQQLDKPWSRDYGGEFIRLLERQQVGTVFQNATIYMR